MPSVVNIERVRPKYDKLNINLGTKVRLRAAGHIGGIGTVTKLNGMVSVEVKWQSGLRNVEYFRNLIRVE
jgi:hypothetical protein